MVVLGSYQFLPGLVFFAGNVPLTCMATIRCLQQSFTEAATAKQCCNVVFICGTAVVVVDCNCISIGFECILQQGFKKCIRSGSLEA